MSFEKVKIGDTVTVKYSLLGKEWTKEKPVADKIDSVLVTTDLEYFEAWSGKQINYNVYLAMRNRRSPPLGIDLIYTGSAQLIEN